MLRFTNSPEARAFEQLNEYVALKRNKGVLQAKLPRIEKARSPGNGCYPVVSGQTEQEEGRGMKTRFHPPRVSLPAILERRDLADAKPQNIALAAKGK